jgi:hypothetical protein
VHQAALIGIPFAILMRCSELVLFARMFVTGSLNHLVYVHETALPTMHKLYIHLVHYVPNFWKVHVCHPIYFRSAW